jgi:tetratricopeptide (TPR) repeat protein
MHPEDPDVLHLLGIIHYQLGNLANAIEYIEKSTGLNPTDAYAYFNLGNIYRDSGQPEQAVRNYRKALQLNPEMDDAYNNMGLALRDEGQTEEAVSCFEQAIQINPEQADTYNNLGITLQSLEKLDEAIQWYHKALRIHPDYVNAHFNLGRALQQKERLGDAIDCFREVIRLTPEHYAAHYCMGRILLEINQIDEAIASFRNAVQLNHDFPEAFHDLGIAYQEKNMTADSIASFRKALLLNPDDADAHWNLSLGLLLSGDFSEGWKEFEWRLKVSAFPPRPFLQPKWDGSDIAGRAILLHEEQGFGDTIQFIRYAPLVAQRGAKVIVECKRELKPLIETVDGLDRVIEQGEELPEFDLHCPLMSLPFVFETTVQSVPATIPYLRAEAGLTGQWRKKVYGVPSRYRIGLVWSTELRFTSHNRRACSLEVFAPLADVEGAAFYSLQKGKAAEEAKTPPEGMLLIDYTGEINDFGDTAALIENLDLVITVDTAVAHVAGALGKPVWNLLPFVPAWRWMLHREDSPWYPTMRLLRQPEPGDWSTPVTTILEELKHKMKHPTSVTHVPEHGH